MRKKVFKFKVLAALLAVAAAAVLNASAAMAANVVPGDVLVIFKNPLNNTSKYGFLDVKKAYDLLPGIIAGSPSAGSSGCDAGPGAAGGLLAVLLLIRKFRKPVY